MLRRHRPRRRRVRRVRRVRRARIPRGVAPATRIQNKVYTYVFKPEALYINNYSDGATPPNLGFKITPTPSSFAINIGGLTSSILPFPQHYDFPMRATFALSDIANYNNFCLMYDQYKLLSVQMDITYIQNNSTLGSATILPTLNITTDQDDATLPTNAIQFLGKQGARRFTYGSKGRTKFTIKFKPNPVQPLQANNASNTAIINTAVPQVGTWIDCLNPAVPHFAIKAWFENCKVYDPATACTAFRIDMTYRVAFKQPLQCS